MNLDNGEHAAAGCGHAVAAGGGVEGPPAATRARPSIEDQRDEVEREARNRERYYPGRLKPETAERKLEHIKAAAKTLSFIAKDPDFFRFVLKHKSELVQIIGVLKHVLDRGPYLPVQIISDVEAELLLADPATRAVVEAYPDSAIGVRSTKPNSDPVRLRDDEGEQDSIDA